MKEHNGMVTVPISVLNAAKALGSIPKIRREFAVGQVTATKLLTQPYGTAKLRVCELRDIQDIVKLKKRYSKSAVIGPIAWSKLRGVSKVLSDIKAITDVAAPVVAHKSKVDMIAAKMCTPELSRLMTDLHDVAILLERLHIDDPSDPLQKKYANKRRSRRKSNNSNLTQALAGMKPLESLDILAGDTVERELS